MNINKSKNELKKFKHLRFSLKLFISFFLVFIVALSTISLLYFNYFTISQDRKKINHQKISSLSLNKTKKSIDSDFSNVVIRRNPINNFSGLDVSKNNNQKAKKLVLTTKKIGKTNFYGVGLVDDHLNIINNWLLSNVENIDTSLNYTTNIIPGKNQNTFFVLAGISNLAKALNIVYDYYNSSQIYFDDVVKTNLDHAPSIKIFKIHVDNDIISSDLDDPYYEFVYPEFSDQFSPGPIKQYAGLLFFDRLGIFCSTKNQQDINNHIYYGAGGYYQYLFYGQLFAYNYENLNEDEFALISSQLGPDIEMGNLYAYYNKKYKSCMSALDNDMFLHDQLSSVFWHTPSDFHHAYEINEQYKSKNKFSYTIQYPDGHIGNASDEDSLTTKAAISIAFMMDFAIQNPVPFGDKSQIYYPNVMHHQFDWVHSSTYIFTPGWFLFLPRTSSVKYSYFVHKRDLKPLNIWFHTVAISYDENSKNYYSLFAGPGYLCENVCEYLYCKFDYFQNDDSTSLYDATPIISSETNLISSSYTTGEQADIPIFSKPFVGNFFSENKILVFFNGATYNDEKWGVFIRDKFYWIKFISGGAFYFTPTLVNFTYDNQSKILSYFDNENIYSIILDDNLPVAKNISKKFLMSLNSFTFIDSGSMIDKQIICSFDGINKIEATWYKVYDTFNKKIYYYISESSIDKNNKASIIDTLDWYEIGHSNLKNDENFTPTEKKQSIKEILSKKPNDLKKLFNFSQRTSGTIKELENRGFLIVNITKDTIGIAEIIFYKNNLLIGFANKHKDTEIISKNEYPFYANYTNVFKQN
ncbi:hypothetical protein [Mycoplasmoides alvi]|uniref:hypothetical protein n=1 Tax=Mycoplasmoides alvi TaxID=78580 RepID=UPI00051ABF48|nr:hypothetical protein [Mycoplasmoides alvi]